MLLRKSKTNKILTTEHAEHAAILWIAIYLFRATSGGKTPLFCLITILIQSTYLHTSPVWTGA